MRIPLIITIEPDCGSEFSSLGVEGLHVDNLLGLINAVAIAVPAPQLDLTENQRKRKSTVTEIRALRGVMIWTKTVAICEKKQIG